MTNIAMKPMAIEIVSFPMNSMVIFHSYVNVYRRITMKWWGFTMTNMEILGIKYEAYRNVGIQ